ncbi:hypothetical protein L7F22_065788 [Adiantum nelumboides]|nr:hypothetical protein [Adiantum nelumboides]
MVMRQQGKTWSRFVEDGGLDLLKSGLLCDERPGLSRYCRCCLPLSAPRFLEMVEAAPLHFVKGNNGGQEDILTWLDHFANVASYHQWHDDFQMNQRLLRVDPAMSEEMKLFFVRPRLRHDIACRVQDQGPTSFHAAIQFAQRIEGSSQSATPLPDRDSLGRPRCYNCNLYGHIHRQCH